MSALMPEAKRPLRNRVNPFGEIVATPERGMFMGNRGCLHDANRQIVRHAARDAWITCLPRWPGIRRQLMRPGHYTELFFLDEATSLAAGHRPCASCRPERWRAFRLAWQRAHDLNLPPKVAEVDAVLGEERGRLVPFEDNAPVDGLMVTDAARSGVRMWRGGEWWKWSFAGYEAATPPAGPLKQVTPPAVVATMLAGYDAYIGAAAG
ncbi:hypothetical protein [Sphingomonas colocasiae]|uniref:Metal-binding protein n=1 Tax=Sphingomonas colocasiae TaxID=1848973 RepID=A0ABS7PVV5_9SPHN|nr:hypothetical protein [Sphingomonas colocasiae]MBY8825492.1 hypothetical protein [Sphingomonas colocasiae]